MLEQPTCRKLAGSLASEAEAGGEGAPVFCSGTEGLDSRLPSWLSVHSPFGLPHILS